MICFQPTQVMFDDLQKLFGIRIDTVQAKDMRRFDIETGIFAQDFNKVNPYRLVVIQGDAIALVIVANSLYRVIEYHTNSGIVVSDKSRTYQWKRNDTSVYSLFDSILEGWSDACLDPNGKSIQASGLIDDFVFIQDDAIIQRGFQYIIHAINDELDADKIEQGLVHDYQITMPYKLEITHGSKELQVKKKAEKSLVTFEVLLTHLRKVID